MATTPAYPSTASPELVAYITTSTATSTFTIVDNSAGTTALKIETLRCCTTNTATASNTLSLYAHDGTTQYLMGSVMIPTLAGAGTVAPVNILASLGGAGPDGVPVIWVPSGKRLDGGLGAGMAATTLSLAITGRTIKYN